MSQNKAAVYRVKDVVLVVCLVCFLAGCRDASDLQLVPTKGKVLLDGKPLSTGRIITKTSTGRGGRAAINEDGSFELGTFEDGDGVQIGNHKVAIIAYETEGEPGNNPEASGRSLVPQRYTRADESELEIVVKPDEETIFTIELTSD